MDKIKRIGMLTSGGDSPGMNAAVVSVARCSMKKGLQLMGIKRGYNGLLGLSENPEDDIEYLDPETVLDIMDMRGTYLRTARCMQFLQPEVRSKAAEDLHKQGIQALVVIGGDGSYHGALELCRLGVPCIGIPGTIDNDLSYTESTLGYDTAVNVCVEAVRSIRATSRSHDRPAVVQVMGRNCGDIAMRTAIATGAEMVIVPEMEWDMEEIADRLKYLISKGNTRATLIISEHCWHKMKPFDWRKIIADSGRVIHDDDTLNAERLALVLKLMSNTEARATVIGYTQRGAIPTAYDSAFAFEAGRMAVELLTSEDGQRDLTTGYAIGVRDGRVYHTPFADALDENKKKFFDENLYHVVNSL
ncbi:MAG: ATP-dependent 6-phosphofructokinase [Eubacteriales bacterium]|nr:ATP-dependent 6-phosphofructokinase [Eubacteriales bacterium]